MKKSVQTNVRVSEDDKALILAVAQKLRIDPSFGVRVKQLLDESGNAALTDRVKLLEEQVARLLSGAIVMPRSVPRVAPSRLPTLTPR